LGTGKISPGSVNAVTDKVTLNFTSATTFDVTDSTTGATLATAQAYTAGSNISFNGWTTQISGTPVTGDAFTVDAAVTSKTLSGVGSTSSIAEAAVAVTANANLKQTVTITFTTPTTYTVTGTGVPAATTGTYNATNGAAISFNGWSAKITGSPQSGDVFTIGANTSGVSDNRNVLALASLQTLKTLSGGTASYQTSYSQLVSFVGNKANETQVMSKAQDSLVATTKATQQSLSGVNLDEEAANLLRYQQAYQASGKLIQIASSLFASILAIGN
jgi:flagellar hook-associated protein 1 FlgK